MDIGTVLDKICLGVSGNGYCERDIALVNEWVAVEVVKPPVTKK
jgi:hypothetical protein